MGASIIVTGNLGQNPEIKFVDLKNSAGAESRAVCEFSVFQSHRRLNKESGDYEDQGGFWVDVSIWGKEAEHLAKILRKGYPVKVEGEMYAWDWVDADQTQRRSMKVEAKRNGVSLLLYGVDSLAMRQAENTGQGSVPQEAIQPENV